MVQEETIRESFFGFHCCRQENCNAASDNRYMMDE